MSKFYKHFPARWNEGTDCLTLEQEGALLRIVNAIHIYDSPLDNNRFLLAGLFRSTTKKANRLLRDLLTAGKVFIVDGKIHNQRADDDIEERHLAAVNASANFDQTATKVQRNPRQSSSKQTVDDPKPLKTKKRTPQNRIEENRVIPSESHCAPAKGGKRANGKVPDPRFQRWFETFLTFFPKRDAPEHVGAIRKAYGKAISRTDPEKINGQAAAYSASVQANRTEPRFVVSAVKWLNEERWHNDYSSRQPGRPLNGNGARG